MTTHRMTLVTIICEALARHHVTRVVDEAGAHGYTLFPVEGRGARGDRPADIVEYGNIQVEVILPDAAAERLLERLHSELFPLYAMIAHATEVKVLRAGKF